VISDETRLDEIKGIVISHEIPIRRDQRGHFLQELAAQDFAFDSEPAPLVVGEQDAAFAEFLSQDLVFGA
jgi:hypothetical protein